MQFIADFHLHSKYSRATSRDMDVENLDKWARIKGIKVLGTGDFTHPLWLKELKEKLEPAEPGLFKLKIKNTKQKNNNDWLSNQIPSDNGTRFMLTSEISCIYSKNNRTRKIHIIVFSPSFSVVEKINTHLGWIGNLKSDGRPILGLDAKELAKIVLNVCGDCLIVPAHCLLPDTYLHSNPGIKMIKDISVGDKVLTHNGRFKKVKQIYNRFYKGLVYNIKPYNFRIGLKTTSEHPFYIIKAYTNCKNCPNTVCKPACVYYQKRGCSHPYFKDYKPQWVQAKDIRKGDIFIFPRFNKKIKNIEEIKLNQYLNQNEYKLDRHLIKPNGLRMRFVPNMIKIDKDFCRLIGYYISEGYTDNRDSISFCFNRRERKYINDLKFLMEKIFGLSSPRIYKRKNTKSIEIIYFSKILAKIFSQLFYNNSEIRKAHTKCLPFWILELPLVKQIEILKGWWRGDAGYTSSRELMNQMKAILLRLGIIPSIREESKEKFNKKEHKIGDRVIKARHSLFSFSNLSFFGDPFDLLKEPEFKRFKTRLKRRHSWMDKKYAYIPVRDIEVTNYQGEVYNLEVDKDNSYVSEFAVVHNCWTPWFSLFGSMSGFDSIEECFEEYSKYIYAGETGLSSDPLMNWRLKALDKITLISNGDAHSPAKIGREANIFKGDEINYKNIIEAIKFGGRAESSLPIKLVSTIEFFPEEGKYHFDGHRKCQINLKPQETKKIKNICPKCHKPLTVGVLHRVDDLADREEGQKPEKAIAFKNLIPLEEIIADAYGVGPGSKRVREEYKNLIKYFGQEFKILLEANREQMEQASSAEIAEGVMRVREGKVYIEPGYDGEYGKIKIFKDEERGKLSKQASLF